MDPKVFITLKTSIFSRLYTVEKVKKLWQNTGRSKIWPPKKEKGPFFMAFGSFLML